MRLARVVGMRWLVLPLLVAMGLGLWLVGVSPEVAAGTALLAGTAAGGLWSIWYVDWEPRRDQPR